jgi:hypothetical protein
MRHEALGVRHGAWALGNGSKEVTLFSNYQMDLSALGLCIHIQFFMALELRTFK